MAIMLPSSNRRLRKTAKRWPQDQSKWVLMDELKRFHHLRFIWSLVQELFWWPAGHPFPFFSFVVINNLALSWKEKWSQRSRLKERKEKMAAIILSVITFAFFLLFEKQRDGQKPPSIHSQCWPSFSFLWVLRTSAVSWHKKRDERRSTSDWLWISEGKEVRPLAYISASSWCQQLVAHSPFPSPTRIPSISLL